MRIVISSGATREPIDSVRFITNLSSGQTGALLTDTLSELGHEVFLLKGAGAANPKTDVRSITFSDFSELDRTLRHVLREERVDAVIHLAAVSDYSVEEVRVGGEICSGPFEGKLTSQGSVEIKLRSNFKIVDRLKMYGALKAPIVVAFKLTSGATQEEWRAAVKKIYSSGQIDLVVHNDTSEMKEGRHPFSIVSSNGEIVVCENSGELAKKLDEFLRSMV